MCEFVWRERKLTTKMHKLVTNSLPWQCRSHVDRFAAFPITLALKGVDTGLPRLVGCHPTATHCPTGCSVALTSTAALPHRDLVRLELLVQKISHPSYDSCTKIQPDAVVPVLGPHGMASSDTLFHRSYTLPQI